MRLWVRTSELASLLAEEVPEEKIELDQERYQTPEEEADELLTALGMPHLMHYLNWGEKANFEHGLIGYKVMKCRCRVCKAAKRKQAADYYRRVIKREEESNP